MLTSSFSYFSKKKIHIKIYKQVETPYVTLPILIPYPPSPKAPTIMTFMWNLSVYIEIILLQDQSINTY